jgi:hypothetical protein
MNLATLQRRVARAVMSPLTPAERIRPSHSGFARKAIKPNDRLSSLERLEIYNRQCWFRLLDALSDDFPGLRVVLGDRRFDALARRYLTDCPSRSFTMRDLGSRLESWLRKHRSFARGRVRLALDMVRLEWAEIETFDGASEPAVTVAEVASDEPATLRLRLQPYICLLDLHYPVDDLLLAVKHHRPLEMASNAMEERRRRKKVAAVARLKPAPIYLAIHRVENMVYLRRLDREEFTILRSLQKGRTLQHAIATAFGSSKIPVAERAPWVAARFRKWSSLGWFVLFRAGAPSIPGELQVAVGVR